MASYPRLDSQWFAGVCELGPRPLVATGWFKLWLQGHFASKLNIEDKPADGSDNSVSKSLWTPDITTTKIYIESVTQWDTKITEGRPSIIIKRNAWKKKRLGIDDRMQFQMDLDGNNRYTNWWIGAHTLFCITGAGAETEKLAAEVFRELNEFGPIVRQILELKRFEVMEVGEVFKIKTDARENFAVPIVVSYVYEEAWTVVQERPPVLKIDLATFQP